MLRLQPVPLRGAALPFRPLPYRPAVATRPSLGQAGAITALGATPLLIGAAVSGVIAWAGFSWASNTKEGWQKALGYILGGFGAIGTILGVGSAFFWGVAVNAASDAMKNQQSTGIPVILPPQPTTIEGFPQQPA